MPYDPSNAPHRKHCKRFNIPGHAHYLTFSCFHRQPFLARDRTRQWLAGAIDSAREKHGFRLWAYVFMPEHVHLLIHPSTRDYSISAILQSIKIPVAKKACGFVEENAPGFLRRMRLSSSDKALHFWQAGGGYDRNIYSPEVLWEKILYTHGNPLRRKLVARSVDWFWSSAADYAKVRNGPLTVDSEGLPWVG